MDSLESGTSVVLKVLHSSGFCEHGTWNLTQELESLSQDEFGGDEMPLALLLFSAAALCVVLWPPSKS